jgi:hypothetical protein
LDSGVVTRVTKSTIERSAGVSFHDGSAGLAAAGACEACGAPWWGALAQALRTTTVNPIQHLRIKQIMKTSLMCDFARHDIRRGPNSCLLNITFSFVV